MPKLLIEKFSCIDQAEVDFRRCTILIGEQGSGKSLISKLIYFFSEVIFSDLSDEIFIKDRFDFRDHIEQKFENFFPFEAWGDRVFSLVFASADYSIAILRKNPKSASSQKLEIQFSEHYRKFLDRHFASIVSTLGEADRGNSPFTEYEQVQEVVQESVDLLNYELQEDFTSWQLFVPAGRSMFTSMGRSVSSLHRSPIADPATVRFGELIYFSIEKRRAARVRRSPGSAKSMLEREIANFVGGDIVVRKDQDYIIADDGRKVPFSFLSSGQQELLPFFLALEEVIISKDKAINLFVEEPEAHIFPTTQSKVVDFVSRHVVNASPASKLLFTTHSPYVLAKINNLAKAFVVGSKKGKKKKTENIIRRNSWIDPKCLSAYLIKDGGAIDIIDEDGLINTDVIDTVSGVIIEEYMRLVDVELG